MTPRARSRLGIALASACGVAALAIAAFATPRLRVVYNASDSVPVGWYRIERAGEPRPGDLVLTRLPADVAELADKRGYLPAHVPLLKRVGAVPPQHVCVRGGLVRIDGAPAAVALRADRWQRPLPQWPQCRRLADGELFLLSTAHPASFDSRYYGPVPAADVIGRARPWRP
ncbi:S26 family signal peptidase [Luteimonas sp. BDR2-5]|uniref:S26 family signal peptidase n=1 Tax=Proluteimonas luteida TaxID=2878685 RepID=UPI001E3DC20B|nr:S26 family signal peptidase [Luteimonas sp. BDR2-5]MCD9026623.1 S26 family signal peptidase [Luteimonas sp. BDR2-5]